MSSVSCERALPSRRAVVIPFAHGVSESVLVERIEHAVAEDQADLVVDLGDARMVGSTVLSALYRGARGLRAQQRRLIVVCRHPSLERLMGLLLLSRAFAVVRSREEAKRRLP